MAKTRDHDWGFGQATANRASTWRRRRRAATALLAMAVVVIGFLGTAVAPASAQSIRFDPQCYGDTVEIRFYRDDVLISLPVALRPSLSLVAIDGRRITGAEKDIWKQQCHPEPILIERFFFFNNSTPVPLLGLTEDGPLPRKLDMKGGPQPAESAARRYERIAAIFKEQYPELPKFTEDGFEFYGAPNGNGIYRPPDKLGSAGGDRPFLHCFFTRGSKYFPKQCFGQIAARGVSLFYEVNLDLFPLNQWAELDRRLRRMLEMIVVESGDPAGAPTTGRQEQ
jgi:hypothetical protein